MVTFTTPTISTSRRDAWLSEAVMVDPSLGMRRRSVKSGAVLLEPGRAASSVYLLHRGQARVFRPGSDADRHAQRITSNDRTSPGERMTDILGPGDWFGIPALAGQGEHSERVIATEACVVTEVPVDQLFTSIARRPQLLANAVRDISAKLEQSREDACDLIFADCFRRLIRTLVRLSESAAASKSGDGVVLRVTHQEIAQMVGVARETVSLALIQLRNQGLLQTGRNQLRFDPRRLESEVDRAAA